MSQLQLAKNLVELRKEKKITQDTLAEFIGVSKASVSKWENGQSFPDIETLPKLASYFNRSIDELMGYEAQLDKKRIRVVYSQLAEQFATHPFDEAFEETKRWMKEYYSCYPFLHQLATLLINHVSLAKEEAIRKEAVQTVIEMCQRICEYSKDVNLCKDTLVIESFAQIMMGKPENVIKLLGGTIRPYMGTDEIIAQAYQLMGEGEKAVVTMQASMFQKLLSIVQMGTGYLAHSILDPEKTKEIIRRLEAVIETFELETLHPSSVMGFYYQAAIIYCKQQQLELAMEKLTEYVRVAKILSENMTIHGDAFFDQIEEWMKEEGLGGKAPRKESVVKASLKDMFLDPAFDVLKEHTEYKLLVKEINKL